MDSDRISVDQREALHTAAPQDYHIERPLVPRYAAGKDESIAWRREGEFSTRAGTLAKLAVALGVREDEIPKDCYADDLIARSPSGRRLLISGGDTDRAFVFRVLDNAIQPASAQRLRCISFDQERRWFIQWQGFLTESLVVGTLRDDDEIESAEPREQLYLLDVDTKTLRRIQMPQVVQPAVFDEIHLRGVSSSALLVYSGHLRQEVTIHLNP